MNRNFFKNKLFIVLVFIGIYLVGFMFSALLGSAKMPHEQFVGFVMTPFNKAGTAVKNFFSDMFSAPFRYDDLEKENEDLRGQLAQARAEADENAYLKIENGNLKKLLDMTDGEQTFSYASADVVARGTDGWSDTLNLNAGTSSGVKEGDIVVSCDGLVGVVSSVGPNWSKVKTLFDTELSVGVMVSTTHDCGILSASADLSAEGVVRLSYIDKNSVLGRGDRLVTSGLGGVFPKSIPVGTVTDVVRRDDGTVWAKVAPHTDISSVERVYIITEIKDGEAQ